MNAENAQPMRPLLRLRHSLVAVAVAAHAVAACNTGIDKDTRPPTAASLDVQQVALILSLSGALAPIGQEAQRGAMVAEQQINALGGVLGRQISFVVKDDQSDPARTAALAKEAKDAGILFAVGPSSSTGALSLREMVTTKQMFFISPSASAVALDGFVNGPDADAGAPAQAGQYGVMWRTQSTDAFEAAAINIFAGVDELSSTKRCANLAFVYQNDDYGAQIYQRVHELWVDRQTNPVMGDGTLANDGYVLLAEQEPDAKYESVARSVWTARAKVGGKNIITACQVVIAQPAIAASYMRAFRKLTPGYPAAGANPDVLKSRTDIDPNATLILTIGSDGMGQAEFIASGKDDPSDPNSPTAGEGSFIIAAQTTDTQNQHYSAFKVLFDAQYPGIDPGRYASTAYDAVVVLALAMESAGANTDVDSVSKQVRKITGVGAVVGPESLAGAFTKIHAGKAINYQAASGNLQFTETGSVRSAYVVSKIANNAFQVVKTIAETNLSSVE